jgi:hypothetical protein
MIAIKEIFYNVPDNVIENVKKYFAEHLPNYDVVKVVRKSVHEAVWYLYMVIGRKREDPYNMGRYACWTSWNETTGCLNHGHYGIKTVSEALEIISEYFFC